MDIFSENTVNEDVSTISGFLLISCFVSIFGTKRLLSWQVPVKVIPRCRKASAVATDVKNLSAKRYFTYPRSSNKPVYDFLSGIG